MRTAIYRAHTGEKLGEIDPKTLIYDGEDNAQPSEDAAAPTGVAWTAPCRDALGNRYRAVYQFTVAETEAAGEEPERLPWDNRHLVRVELSED